MKKNLAAVLFGGTLYDEQKKTYRNSTTKLGNEIKMDSKEYEKDFSQLEKILIQKGYKVYANYPPKLKSQKDEVVICLKNFFNTVFSEIYLIYWSGHGEIQTGDWTFSNDKILKIDELFNLWTESNAGKNNKTLILISDSCYSGYWIELLKKNPPNFNLLYQTGCSTGEESWINLSVDRNLKSKSYIFGSFLLNKMFYEEENKYVWTCSRQHPRVYTTVNISSFNGIGETTYKFSNLKFYEIPHHWQVKSHGNEAFLILKQEVYTRKKEEGFYFEKDF